VDIAISVGSVDTRHNVTVVRFNDDDRGDWSRPTVAVVSIMHNLMRKTEHVERVEPIWPFEIHYVSVVISIK